MILPLLLHRDVLAFDESNWGHGFGAAFLSPVAHAHSDDFGLSSPLTALDMLSAKYCAEMG